MLNSEEIHHNLLLPKGVVTYVVENGTNNITDIVAYSVPSSFLNAHFFLVVSTKSPVKQLIINALVCARENNVRTASVCQHNIESDVLVSLSFQPSNYSTFHLYNFKYHEVSQTKFWTMTF